MVGTRNRSSLFAQDQKPEDSRERGIGCVEYRRTPGAQPGHRRIDRRVADDDSDETGDQKGKELPRRKQRPPQTSNLRVGPQLTFHIVTARSENDAGGAAGLAPGKTLAQFPASACEGHPFGGRDITSVVAGHVYALLNAKTLDGANLFTVTPADFDGEAVDGRLKRRSASGSPDFKIGSPGAEL